MKRELLRLLAGSVFALNTSAAQAALIVDTGQPTGMWVIVLGASPANPVGNQWLAGEFTISGDYTITGVEGWIEGFGSGEELSIAIYTDGGDVPGAELFSQAVSGTGDGYPETWKGVSGLSWNLAAGTYWISYERRDGQSLTALMRADAPNALSNYAYRSYPDGWQEYDSFNLGVRISGNPIPEFATLTLLGLGFAGISCARKRMAV